MISSELPPTRILLPHERSTDHLPAPLPHRPGRRLAVVKTVLGIVTMVLWFRLSGNITRQELAVKIRLRLESLGHLWIKVAQILALRVDLFSNEFCNELSAIRDIGESLSFEEVLDVIEADMNIRSIDTLFKDFSTKPFLVTSFYQLHRAFLVKEGVWVVVKIQKPCGKKNFQVDSKILDLIAKILIKFSIRLNMNWSYLVKQIEDLMSKELDFRYELSSLKKLKKNLKRDKIYVPVTFRR